MTWMIEPMSREQIISSNVQVLDSYHSTSGTCEVPPWNTGMTRNWLASVQDCPAAFCAMQVGCLLGSESQNNPGRHGSSLLQLAPTSPRGTH